jgi:hypothetical protein
MIDSYLTDTIDIMTRTVDDWGASSETTQASVKCRVEDTNRLIMDKDGKEVHAEAHLFIDKKAVLSYASRIKIKTRDGEPAELPNKEWPIKKFLKAHGFFISHWEVWL